MIDEKYACAYKEVIEILKYTKEEDVNKIPKYRILLWKKNMKKDYDFKVDVNKPIEEQNLSLEAKAILANIFKKYWATDFQKEKIEAKEKYDFEQLEKEKSEKYNPNDIFKVEEKDKEQIKKETVIEEKGPNEVLAVETQMSFFKKFIDKIKKWFKK